MNQSNLGLGSREAGCAESDSEVGLFSLLTHQSPADVRHVVRVQLRRGARTRKGSCCGGRQGRAAAEGEPECWTSAEDEGDAAAGAGSMMEMIAERRDGAEMGWGN
ncbi:unnamed protein product [Linum trigynum]|uniref:Uncharacterized protein n=1 Tax=Linum trigynum TaxID=586398 RepID=A0AAV2E317_9ROSI